jgi:putative transposase
VGSTGGKKVKGRKRHILVDTMGNLLLVMVPSAGWSDQEGGTWLLVKALHRFGTVLKVWADSASRGDLITLIRDLFEVDLEVVRKDPNQEGFVVQARRGVVERSLGWYSRNRRLSKDYEHLCEVSETMVYIAAIQVMLKRLRPDTRIDKPYLPRKPPPAA